MLTPLSKVAQIVDHMSKSGMHFFSTFPLPFRSATFAWPSPMLILKQIAILVLKEDRFGCECLTFSQARGQYHFGECAYHYWGFIWLSNMSKLAKTQQINEHKLNLDRCDCSYVITLKWKIIGCKLTSIKNFQLAKRAQNTKEFNYDKWWMRSLVFGLRFTAPCFFCLFNEFK